MSRKGYPSEKLDQYMLRLPDGMRDRIKTAAEAANRSMNAEIVATLEEKYPAPVPKRGGGHALRILAKLDLLRRKSKMASTQEEEDKIQAQYDSAMAELREIMATLDPLEGEGMED